MLFGFSIGINVSYRYHPFPPTRLIVIKYQVTFAVFIGTPPPVGYGLGPFAVAGAYG